MEPWRTRGPQVAEVQNRRIKDAVLDGLALDHVSAAAAREGELRLWNPYIGGGVPHLAAGFSRMLYPPFWIYGVLDVSTARNLEILGHLALAELLVFAWLRRLRLGLRPALFGALVYGFNPSIVHRAEIPFILPTLVWLPALLLATETALTGRLRRALVLLSLVVALQFLAGHWPDIFLHGVCTAVYAAARLLALRREPGLPARVAVLGAGVGLGIALAGPFVLPSVALMADTNREVRTVEEVAATGVGADILFTLLTPYWQRSQLFLGLVPLVFVPAAFARGRRAVAAALAAMGALSLAIATGGPLFRLLWSVLPGVSSLRYVDTHVSVASFALALLSALGLGAALRRGARPEMAALGVLAVVAAGVMGLDGGVTWVACLQRGGATAVLAGLGALVLLAHRRRVLGRTGAVAALALLAAADLFGFARAFNPRVDAERWPPFPAFDTVAFLQRDPEPFRVATLRGPDGRRPFLPNTLAPYAIEDVAAYHSLLPRRVGRHLEQLARAMGGAPRVAFLDGEGAGHNLVQLASFADNPLLHVFNVRYVVLPSGAPNPQADALDLVHDGDTRVYRVRRARPRVWMAERAVVVPGEGALQVLGDPGHDPATAVVLGDEPVCHVDAQPGTKVAPGTPPAARILARGPEHLIVETTSPRPGFLVVSEAYDPDWTAQVDGRPATTLRANGVFRAVALSAGTHRVEFRYRPPGLRWGAAAAGVAALGLLAGWLAFGSPAFVPATVLAAALALGVLAAGARVHPSEPAPCGALGLVGRPLGVSPLLEGAPRRAGREVMAGTEVPLPLPAGAARLLRLPLAAGGGPVAATVRDERGVELAAVALEPGTGFHVLEVPLPAASTRALLSSQGGDGARVFVGDPAVFAPGAAGPREVCVTAVGEPRLRRGLGAGDLDEEWGLPAPWAAGVGRLMPELARYGGRFTVTPPPETNPGEATNVLRRRFARLGLRREIAWDTCPSSDARPHVKVPAGED